MFDGSVDYALEIEKRTRGKNPSYLDAVLDVSESCGIEPQALAKYLSKSTVEKIRIEATGKNLLRGKEKYKGTRLPL